MEASTLGESLCLLTACGGSGSGGSGDGGDPAGSLTLTIDGELTPIASLQKSILDNYLNKNNSELSDVLIVLPDAKKVYVKGRLTVSDSKLIEVDLSTPSKPKLGRVIEYNGSPFKTLFSKDGKTAYIANNGFSGGVGGFGLVALDIKSFTIKSHIVPATTGQHNSMSLSGDGKTLATVRWNNETGESRSILTIYDVNGSELTQLVTGKISDQHANSLALSKDGNTIFIAFSEGDSSSNNEAKITILDISNKNKLNLLSNLTLTDSAYPSSITLSKNEKYIFFGGTRKLFIADISNPEKPTIASIIEDFSIDTMELSKDKNILFTSDTSYGSYILDVKNPLIPRIMRSYSGHLGEDTINLSQQKVPEAYRLIGSTIYRTDLVDKDKPAQIVQNFDKAKLRYIVPDIKSKNIYATIRKSNNIIQWHYASQTGDNYREDRTSNEHFGSNEFPIVNQLGEYGIKGGLNQHGITQFNLNVIEGAHSYRSEAKINVYKASY